MEYHRFRERIPLQTLVAPFIYGMFIPFVLFDVCLEVYHRVCFPVYRIPYVKRSEYIVFDRAKLSYLTGADRVNCTYCSYANGLMRYAVRIVSLTESYWCNIKHSPESKPKNSSYSRNYIEYGDRRTYLSTITEGYEKVLRRWRRG